MKALPSALILSLVAIGAVAEEIPFDSERWKVAAREWRIEEHLGRRSLFLDNGQAWLEGLELLDGEVEFDVAFTPQRGFAGAMFRLVDEVNYEHFYLRPHQSGNPDANQYTPVFDAVSGWQLFHGRSYAAPTVYPTDEWIHVRIVFIGDRADIYIDSDEPTVSVELKRQSVAGSVGLSSFLSDARYSRFRVRDASGEELIGAPVPEADPPADVVTEWSVSQALPEALVDGVERLSESDLPALEWMSLEAEATGVVNLARRGRRTREENTVFARTTIHSEQAGTRRVRFGFSDRVRVFSGDRLVYSGDNGYQTRDYRFLGTIGLFDEIAIDVEPGENPLVFAVSESFGGWGIVAALPE
jgi:hypothetical protein